VSLRSAIGDDDGTQQFWFALDIPEDADDEEQLIAKVNRGWRVNRLDMKATRGIWTEDRDPVAPS
jgi:hypothetical protein